MKSPDRLAFERWWTKEAGLPLNGLMAGWAWSGFRAALEYLRDKEVK